MRHRLASLLSLGLCGGLALAANLALAKGGSLAIAGLTSPPYLVGLDDEIAHAAAIAAQGQGFTVLGPEAVLHALGEPAMGQLALCEERAACLAALLAPLGVGRALGGTLAQSETAYVVHLWVLDLPSKRIVARLDRAILIASRRLEADLALALPKLLAGQTEADGALLVQSAPREAEVTIDDSLAGRGDGVAISVAPGRHRVVIQAPGYLPTERWIEVSADQTLRLEERLVSAEGKVAALSPDVPSASPERATHAGGAGLPLGSYLAAAVAAGLLGGGLYFGLQANAIDHRAGQLDANGVDQGITRAQAVAGLTDARVGNVLFIGAGVALAIAVAFGVFTPAPAGADAQAPPFACAGGSALTWSLP